MADEKSVDVSESEFTLLIEHGTKSDSDILFFAITGLILWIFTTIFGWLLAGYITRNKRRLSTALIFATVGVLLFSWMDGFAVFILQTNVFVSDAQYVMQYQCAASLHSTALCYGLYRYSLYMFFLIRIRHFFKGTSHEFRTQKCVAAFIIISILMFCFTCVFTFYLTPSVVYSSKYIMCYPKLNDELREEILIFLIMDVFVSLYLTWLFVIKSRALLALENANKPPKNRHNNNNDGNNDNNDADNDDDNTSQDDDIPLRVNYGIDNIDMPRTYFIDELNGGLKSKSVRKLMLRCIYFGMLAMMVTWIHLGLRFIEFTNIHCVEELISCMCVLLSFDITAEGKLTLCCWCGVDMGDLHGYGRNLPSRNMSGSRVNTTQQIRRNIHANRDYNQVPNTDQDIDQSDGAL